MRLSRLSIAAAWLACIGAVASPAVAQPKREPPKLTKSPKVLAPGEVPYPESEAATRRSAVVVVRLAIGAEGRVTEVEIVESAGTAFDAAALSAAKALVFEPAEIDGKPAPIRLLYRFRFEPKPEKPTRGVVAGVLRDRKSGKPLEGLRVELDDGRSATTDAAGRFSFEDVAPGERALTLSGKDRTATRTTETVEAGKKVDVTYDLEAPTPASADDDDLEIVVRAPAITKQVATTSIDAGDARRMAGTQGDVLKIVDSMPGVGRASAGSAALVVWGAAPEDTRVYFDGIRLPRLYHEGGVRSVVSGELVKSVELAPGGHGAAWGRGLGGIVRVTSRPLDEDGVHGAVSVDVLDAAGTARFRVSERWTAAVALRRGHLDPLVSAVASDDVRDVFPIPRYADGQARLAYRIDTRSTFEVLALASDDQLKRTVASADPSGRRSDERRVRFERVGARWVTNGDDGGSADAVAWVGRDHRELTTAFGSVPTSLSESTTLFGARARARSRVTRAVTVEVGLDAEVSRSHIARSGSITSPPREGDPRLFGVPPSDQVNSDAISTWIGSVATYGELDVAPFGDLLHVVPGLRFEPYVIGTSRRTPAVGSTPEIGALDEDVALAPRLAVRSVLSPRVELRLAWGTYHQAPAAEDLSPVFGNPSLRLSRARHTVGGGTFQLGSGVSTEVTAFRSTFSDLPVRTPLASPLLAEALVQTGSGSAYGAQWLVRMSGKGGSNGWLAYTLSRSERRDADGARTRAFDYDQTHVLTATFTLDLGRGFEIGARARYATGLPRTAVVGTYYDSRVDRFQPVLGERNGIRLPAFAQLDLRAAKKFSLGPAGAVEVYLDLLNATARKNTEELVYSSDFSQRKAISGLPILPVAGARWTF